MQPPIFMLFNVTTYGDSVLKQESQLVEFLFDAIVMILVFTGDRMKVDAAGQFRQQLLIALIELEHKPFHVLRRRQI